MSRTPMAVATALLALVTMTGCAATVGPDETSSGSREQVGGADVAAPALARLRERAGIDPCPVTDATAPVRDDGLPALVLPCLGGGRAVDLAQLRGRPLVLTLWASWCGPCRDELPLFQRLHERAGSQLTVLGVDIDDPEPGQALGLAAATGVTFPLVADPDASLRGPLQVMGLPQTVFVAADGRVVMTERRVLTSYDELADLVREHLAVVV